ncbi:MAG: hypothetical protein ACYC5H_12635 [Methylovirgula sp.]
MKIAPPEGIAEEDYEAIEAAVMETVRGRWFLAEFARRSRVDEMRQMLDAVARLEQVVVEQRSAPADPSIRLLVQRLKDVAQQLNGLVADMRLQGYDETLCARIEAQARSVGGVLRLNAPNSALPASGEPFRAAPPRAQLNDPQSRESLAEQTAAPPLPLSAPPQPSPAPTPVSSAAPPVADQQTGAAARLAGLARLDALPLAEKLALFG